MDIVTLIQQFGFPVTCVLGMGWFFYVQYKNSREDNKSREDKMFTQLDKFGDSLNSFNTTLQSIDKRLETVEKKLES